MLVEVTMLPGTLCSPLGESHMQCVHANMNAAPEEDTKGHKAKDMV